MEREALVIYEEERLRTRFSQRALMDAALARILELHPVSPVDRIQRKISEDCRLVICVPAFNEPCVLEECDLERDRDPNCSPLLGQLCVVFMKLA
jgi:hypothetical protein